MHINFNVKDYKLLEATYTISDFSITNGQDPDHVNKVGQVRNFVGDVTFRVGRKGSSQVATWWRNHIASYQNTFNKGPDDLNFAFIGKLSIVLTGGSLGGAQERFTLDDIAFAQGHAIDNNWWFGGKNCSYLSDNTVRAAAKSANKGTWHFDFHRGSFPQQPNEIELKAISTS